MAAPADAGILTQETVGVGLPLALHSRLMAAARRTTRRPSGGEAITIGGTARQLQIECESRWA